MSSRQSKALFCQVRKEFVQETPEERVRQNTLSSLFSLGYPASLMVVERKMAELVADFVNVKTAMPNRRIDILCYQGASLQPLLLIECKANSFNSKELRQLLGYNFYIQARFIALVNPQRVQFFDVETHRELNHFPEYHTLNSP